MLPRNHARQHDGMLDLKEFGHWSCQRHDFWMRHKELVVAESLISCENTSSRNCMFVYAIILALIALKHTSAASELCLISPK